MLTHQLSSGSSLARRNAAGRARSRLAPVCSAVQIQANPLDTALAWAKANSIDTSKVTKSVSIATNEPLLVASRDLAAGEAVFSVPDALWLSPEAVQQSKRIGNMVDGLEPWLQLALYVLAEKAQPSGGAMQAYVDSLPANLDSPLFWSDEELAMLKGTQLLGNVMAYKAFFQQRFTELDAQLFSAHRDVFPAGVATLHNFMWAVSSVRSRTHGPLDGDSIALVPVADTLAHRRGGNTAWKVKASGLFGKSRTLSVEASKAIRKGEEVCMDYGPAQLDSAILLDYGVMDTSSPQGGYTLTLALPDSDRYFDDKIDILERNGLGQSATFTLQPGQQPGETMLGFLRLMQLSGGDAFLLEAVFEQQVWSFMCEPVSGDNEASVCTSMVEGAREALAGYPTSIQEDLALLRSGSLQPGSRQELAVRVRLGEKEALDGVLTFFEGRLENLSELEYYQERRLKRLGLMDEQGNTTYDSFFRDGIA